MLHTLHTFSYALPVPVPVPVPVPDPMAREEQCGISASVRRALGSTSRRRGTNKESNIVAACLHCNQLRHARKMAPRPLAFGGMCRGA